MTVQIGDVVRITARMLLDGASDVVNVFHFVVDANTSLDDTAFMADVAVSMDALYTGINNRVSDRISYSSVQGFNVTQGVLLPDTAWPILVAGADVGDMLPEMSTACCFHRTVVPRVRASKFLPPATETSNTGGALEVVYKGLVTTFANFLLLGLVGVTTDLQYVAFNVLLTTFTRVVSAQVPARWRTQKRRRIGVGS